MLSQTFDGVEKLDILRMPKNTLREIALHATFGTSVKLRHPLLDPQQETSGVFQHHSWFVVRVEAHPTRNN